MKAIKVDCALDFADCKRKCETVLAPCRRVNSLIFY